QPDEEIAEVVIDPFVTPWPLSGAAGRPARPEPPLDRPQARPAAAGPLGGILSDPARAFDLREALKRVERDLLQQALAAQRYNQRATALQLGLSYDQLRGRLRKHGLLRESGGDAAGES